MTLTAEESSHKAEFEAIPTDKVIAVIRLAMAEGCIRPSHVYDLVDELICRVERLEAAIEPVLSIDISALERYPLDEDDLDDITIYAPMDNGLYEENSFTKKAQMAILKCPNAIRKAKEIFKKEE